MAELFMWVVTDEEKKEYILSFVRQAFNCAHITTHIPVDNPVSLEKANISLLAEAEYIVSYKADGVRYLLVLCMYKGRPLAAFVDRAGHVFSLYVMAHVTHFQKGCVFDGELCEIEPNIYNYVVFNALIDQGIYLGDFAYTNRLRHVRQNFQGEQATQSTSIRIPSTFITAAADHALTFFRKEYDVFQNLRTFTSTINPRYKQDGLVFTPSKEGVVPGRNEHLLKWKSENPIDVHVIYENNSELRLYIDNNGTDILLADALSIPVEFDLKDIQFQSLLRGAQIYNSLFCAESTTFDHIIEVSCAFSGKTLNLQYLRLRPDKDGANNVTTVQRTLQTICDNVTIDDIYGMIPYTI